MRDNLFIIEICLYTGLALVILSILWSVVKYILSNRKERQFKPRTRGERMTVNGYLIRFNEHWKEFQVSHPEIGPCEEFNSKEEAIDHAKRG